MRAVTWHGPHDVRVEDVPDPAVQEATDAVIRVTSSGICGSDLHLYEVFGPFLQEGDILGHEALGVVEEVGTGVTDLTPGDRVVIPFQIACGRCFMCRAGLQTQCETTQVRARGMGAALYGYTQLYGGIPGAQAEYLRVPHADYNPIKVPEGVPDDRYLYLSDALPTAWQAVAYATIPAGGSVAVLGLGPVGDLACRIAAYHGYRVIGVDLVPERLGRAAAYGAEVVDLHEHEDGTIGDAVRDLTDGRGPDAVIDAVGLEAHGGTAARIAQLGGRLLPDPLARRLARSAGVERLAALNTAIDLVRRGGTISVVGVYGGQVDPIPMLTVVDKQIRLCMGQANVRRWVDEIVPLLLDGDPLGVDAFATHHLGLEDAPHGYRIFREKEDGACKVVLRPWG